MSRRLRPLNRAAFLLAGLMALGEPSFSQNGEKPVPLGSPVYHWLAALYTENGLAFPSRSTPFTVAQVLGFLDQLGTEGELGSAIRQVLEEKTLYTEAGSDAANPGLALAIHTELNPELYLGLGQEKRIWDYGYNDRPPLARILTEAWAFQWLYMAIDFQGKKEPFAVVDQSQPISNVPTQVVQLDFQWPYWAGVVAGGPHWDARFFRSQASLAVSEWNLILSKDAGPVDQISLSTWWNNFSYTFLWIPADNTWVTNDFAYGYPSTTENDTGNAISYDQSKNFLVHRVQFRPVPSWSVALSEIMLLETNVFDPRYFNPMIPGHSWFIYENANSDLSLEIEGSPLPGWTVWGQFYGDYIKTPVKDALYNDPTPGAVGYLGGTRVVTELADKTLTVEAEAVYTDPFLYLNNHANMINTIRYESSYGTPGRRMIDTPFGFKMGPDTIAVRSLLRLEKPNQWRAEVGFPFQVRGENTIRTLHPLQQYAWTVPANIVLNPLFGHPEIYANWVTPTGIPEWKQGFSAGGEFHLPWDSWIGFQSTLTLIWNQAHVVAPMTWDWQTILTWKNTF